MSIKDRMQKTDDEIAAKMAPCLKVCEEFATELMRRWRATVKAVEWEYRIGHPENFILILAVAEDGSTLELMRIYPYQFKYDPKAIEDGFDGKYRDLSVHKMMNRFYSRELKDK
jgi:hypothetical protein